MTIPTSMAVKCQWVNFGAPDGLFSAREAAFGIHGGDRETSLMLHFRPELVNMEEAKDFTSTAESSRIAPIGPVSYGWVSSDLNPSGTVGEANLATSDKGEQLTRHQVAGFIDLLRKVRDTPLGEFVPTSNGPS